MKKITLDKIAAVGRGFTAEDYVDSHEALRRSSNQKHQILDWFRNAGLLEAGSESVVPSVLSVGSGAGDIDCLLIEHFERRGVPFAYDALEPNGAALSVFRDRCGEMQPSMVNRVRLYACGFEHFAAGQAYDLIHFVHAIYGIEDVHGMMNKAFGMLAPGGTLGVICSTDEGVNNFKRDVFEIIDLPGRAGRVREQALVSSLSEIEGAALDFEIVPSEIDVTECLNSTPEGDLLMSFFLQADFAALETGEQIAVLQVLSEHVQERDGRMMLNQPMLGITARKRREGRPSQVALTVRGGGDLGALTVSA